MDKLTRDWRACQVRVNALERQYADEMLAYCRGEGPLPPAQTKAELLALRRQAEELLDKALREIDRRMIDSERRLGKANKHLGPG